MDSDRASRACAQIDISFATSDSKPGLFDIFDRDESGFVDRDEFALLHAELEARRRVAETEVWSRLHMSQRDLFKILPLGAQDGSVATGIHGFEFASPHCNSVQECADVRYSTILRVSSWSTWLGEYLRLGQSRHKNVTTCVSTSAGPHDVPAMSTEKCGWHLELQPLSHVYMDAPIQGECPLQLSGGSENHHTTVCLDAPTEDRTLLLPDKSGVIITTANLADISSLVGLRGNRTMQYTGEAHTHSQQWKFGVHDLLGPLPPQPRVDCSRQNCSAGAGGSRPKSTFEFEYGSHVWHALDLKLWRQTRESGLWLSKTPSYFSFVCPPASPECDIVDHMNSINTKFGVKFDRRPSAIPLTAWGRTDGYVVSSTSSPWPQLVGDWDIVSPTQWILSPVVPSASSGASITSTHDILYSTNTHTHWCIYSVCKHAHTCTRWIYIKVFMYKCSYGVPTNDRLDKWSVYFWKGVLFLWGSVPRAA